LKLNSLTAMIQKGIGEVPFIMPQSCSVETSQLKFTPSIVPRKDQAGWV